MTIEGKGRRTGQRQSHVTGPDDGVYRNHISFADKVLTSRTDSSFGTTVFYGTSQLTFADPSAAVWRICRVFGGPFGEVTEYIGDGKFDQVWDDRVSLFPDPPFLNNYSVQFGGVSEWVDCDHDAAHSFDFRTEAASWVFWCKTSASAPAGMTFFEKQGGSNPGWRIYIASNRMTLELKGTGGTSDRIRVRGPSVVVDDGLWHMMTITYDGSGDASGVNIYMDTILESSLDVQNDLLVTDTSTTVNMGIGGRTGGGNTFGPGNFDEVSIHNVELTQTQINTIYNSGFPIDLQGQGVDPITANLKFFLRCGDGPSDNPSALTLVDVESGTVCTMSGGMTEGDIETEVPSG